MHSYEGFQTHLSNLESQLVYFLSKDGVLSFEVHFEIQDEVGEIVDFDDWMYVKGKGFYSKTSSRTGTFIKPGLKVLQPDISSFISSHKEELEQIKNFFSSSCPIEKMGVKITLNDRKQILVKPEFFLRSSYEPSQVRIFGDYAFCQE